jgi:plastocyanin
MVSAMRGRRWTVGAALAALAMALLVMRPSGAAETQTCAGSSSTQTADAKVILKNTAYNPATVTMGGPGTVCWEHQDGEIGHSITSDATPGATDYFDSNPYCTGANDPNCFQQSDSAAFKIDFTTAGTYKYHCRVHPDMRGTIVVQGTVPIVTTTTQAGASTTSTTRGSTTNTTVGTLSSTTTTAATGDTTTTTAVEESTTTSTLDLTTQTTAPGTALGPKDSSDDNKPSGVLEAVGIVLLAAVIAALIPAWRRLT